MQFRFRPAFALTLSLLTAACVTTQVVDVDADSLLAKSPTGSFVSGTPLGLGEPQVVNRRDFIYALDFDDASKRLAFVHHVSTEMEVTLTGLNPLAPVFQEKLNRSEFDNEDVVIDGDRLLVPSRQGILRAMNAQNGVKLEEVSMGEALLRVAVGADRVLVGSADGRVFIFDRDLALLGESSAHTDEVRGLVALPDGRVISTSMDGRLLISHIAPATKPLVRLSVSPLASGEQVFLAHLAGRKAIATVRDARQPSSVISRAAVKRLELPPTDDGQELTVLTAEGEQRFPAIKVGEVRLRSLSLGDVVAAVCDACVPAGAELVLGADVLGRASLVEDVAAGELVAKPQSEGNGVGLVPGAVELVTDTTITLPGPANDLDVAIAAGKALVTFSLDKAERTFDVHDHEKKGDFPPPSPKSGAALVDLGTGTLGTLFVNQHLGYTVTGAISPDGKTVVTGGWDRRALVWDTATAKVVTERSFAWLVRRVRFSPDGRLLGVAAWTPVNALNEGDSEPSMVLYPVALESATVVVPGA